MHISSKYKKWIFIWLWVFFISIIWWTLYFQHKKKQDNKKQEIVKQTVDPTKINQVCTLNLPYFYVSKLETLKNWYKGLWIKIKTINNISDSNVIKCTLKDKNSKLLDSLLTNWILKDYLTYSKTENKQKHEYKIIRTGIKDFNFIKNNKITIVKVWNNNNNQFLYFKDDPENKVFFRALQKVNQQLALWLRLDIKKVAGLLTFKYNKIKSRFGEDSIVTNTKIVVKLVPNDFKLLKEKINQEKNTLLLKTIENLEKVSNVYDNSIIYEWKYIIIKDLKKLVQSIQDKK